MLVCLLSTSALLSSMVVGAMHETSVVQVSQEPPVVTLMRLNASAEISCSYSGLPKPEGLSLRQHFGGKEIMFMHIKSNKEIVQPHFDGRLTISADHGAGDRRCHFTIRLEQLQVKDTDGYYCHWKGLDEAGNVQEEKSNYTLIIVRARDPSEPCSSPSDPSDPLPRLFLGVSGLVFCLMLITFIGAVIWRCTLSTGRFEPQRMRQTKLRHPPPPPPHPHHHHHHHHHHPLPENRPLPLLPPPQTQLNHHHDDSLHHSNHHQADHHNHHHQSQSQSHHSTHNGHSHNGHQTQHPQTQHPQTYDEPPHHHDPHQSEHPHPHPSPHREDQFNHQNQRQQIYDHLPLHHRQSLPLPHHPPHPNHHHPHRQTVHHHHHPHHQTVHHHPHHHPHHLDKQQLHSTISFPSPHHRSSQVNRH